MKLTVRKMTFRVAQVAVFLAVVAWLIDYARRAAKDAQCTSHLGQLSLALRSYHSVYGSFPPAYAADDVGRPMHSWRVLILPFLEEGNLYNRYNFGEPWDGPHNQTLLPMVPQIYTCPNHRGDSRDARFRGTRWTSYLAVTGPGTLFPGSKSSSLTDLSRDAERLVLIAEVANIDIPWTAPIDLDVRTMDFTINAPDGSRPAISTRDPYGPHVVFADGSQDRLSESMSPEEVKGLLTVGGVEMIDFPEQAGSN